VKQFVIGSYQRLVDTPGENGFFEWVLKYHKTKNHPVIGRFMAFMRLIWYVHQFWYENIALTRLGACFFYSQYKRRTYYFLKSAL
jgi:hypothetical protein